LLILPEFPNAEVRTHTRNACICQNSPEFGSRVFGEAGEAGIGVTYWRAQLDRLKSGLGKLLDRTGKVLVDHCSDRPRLASDWDAKRIGAKLQREGGQISSHSSLVRRTFQKLSSGNRRH